MFKLHLLPSSCPIALAILVMGLSSPFSQSALAAEYDSGIGAVRSSGSGPDAVKSYLVQQVIKINQASDDFLKNAEAYQQIIDANGGDYNKAAMTSGAQILSLIVRMQNDYRNLHMNGYETVEGISAGVKSLVKYDIYFDSGVPKSESATDNPAAPVVIRTATGELVADRDGNIFHYVIEPALWGSKRQFVKKLSPEASQKVHGVVVLPRADVVLATAKECKREADDFLADSKNWNPTLAECFGALVWMTPTFNTYFNDLRDSLYSPTGRYVSESRVLDMRGIMGSLQLSYEAIMPEIEKKDAALANQLKSEYASIMSYIDETDARDKRARASGSKLSLVALQEMASQAKTMSDQLAPQLNQGAAIVGVKIPAKPYL